MDQTAAIKQKLSYEFSIIEMFKQQIESTREAYLAAAEWLGKVDQLVWRTHENNRYREPSSLEEITMFRMVCDGLKSFTTDAERVVEQYMGFCVSVYNHKHK